jgi:hypothetical protein
MMDLPILPVAEMGKQTAKEYDLTVTVVDQDVAYADTRPELCPIQVAVRSANGVIDAIVGAGDIQVLDRHGYVWHGTLPPGGELGRIRYDGGHGFSPCSFTVRLARGRQVRLTVNNSYNDDRYES